MPNTQPTQALVPTSPHASLHSGGRVTIAALHPFCRQAFPPPAAPALHPGEPRYCYVPSTPMQTREALQPKCQSSGRTPLLRHQEWLPASTVGAQLNLGSDHQAAPSDFPSLAPTTPLANRAERTMRAPPPRTAQALRSSMKVTAPCPRATVGWPQVLRPEPEQIAGSIRQRRALQIATSSTARQGIEWLPCTVAVS